MKKLLLLLALLTGGALTLVGCGGGSTGSNFNSGNPGPSSVFVTGEDAPVSAVVSFKVTINSIMLNNGSTSVAALNAPTAVDFGRLVGLRSLLAFSSIPAGTYTGATISFASSNPAPSVQYVDLTTNPPSIAAATGTFSGSTVTVSFPSGKPLTVSSSGLAGLHIDFNLEKSLAIDANGNLIVTNGQIAITPSIAIQAVSASDDLGQITDFAGNVVSVNASANTFLMQGPYGFQEKIDVNSSTQYNGSNSLASITADDVVSVEGTVQADGSILASSVEVVTTDKAFISGRILAVNAGPLVTMYVGEELGASATIPVGSVYTVNLGQVSRFDICFLDNWFTGQLFNSTSLVVGQRIFVGGTYLSSVFTPDFVSLRRQGVVGALVTNSVNITAGNTGSFQMQNDALMSFAAGGPFTVHTVDKTTFVNVNGLAGLQAAGSANLIARGLVLKDPVSGKPTVWAARVRVLP